MCVHYSLIIQKQIMNFDFPPFTSFSSQKAPPVTQKHKYPYQSHNMTPFISASYDKIS